MSEKLEDISKYSKVTRLAKESESIDFSIRCDYTDYKITIVYHDLKEKEHFHNYSLFLYAYSCHNRAILQSLETIKEKINQCDSFLHDMYLFLTDHKGFAKNKLGFEKEIRVYIEQVQFFNAQYRDHIDLPVNKSIDKLSTNEKIILLQYVGVLDILKEGAESNNEKTSKLISVLIGANWENIYDALNKVNAKPTNKDGVKTFKTLNRLKSKLTDLKLKTLLNKVEADLKKIS